MRILRRLLPALACIAAVVGVVPVGRATVAPAAPVVARSTTVRLDQISLSVTSYTGKKCTVTPVTRSATLSPGQSVVLARSGTDACGDGWVDQRFTVRATSDMKRSGHAVGVTVSNELRIFKKVGSDWDLRRTNNASAGTYRLPTSPTVWTSGNWTGQSLSIADGTASGKVTFKVNLFDL
jgi:hypothetical protein